MAKQESVSYPFVMSNEQLKIFLDKIKDLVSINDTIQMKIDNEHVMIYSLVGEKKNINAFKSFIIKTPEIFKLKVPLESPIKYIVPSGKKFDRSIRNFIDFEEDIQCEFFMDDDEFVNNLSLKNSRLRLNYTGGDFLALNFNYTVEQLKSTMNTADADFKFTLDKLNFTRIKKWSMIDLNNDIYHLTIKDKVLTIGEEKWDLNICKVDFDDLTITFPKKYFNAINFPDKDEVEIFVFDSKILIDNEKTSLLIALELSV